MTELQNDLTILGKIWISGYPKFLLDYVPTAIFLHKGEISLACLSAQQQKNPVARSYPVLTVGIGFSFDCIIAVFSALLPLQYPRSFVSSWKLDDILGRLAESNCYRIENIFPSSCCCNFLTDGGGNRASQIHLLLHSRCPKKLWHSKLNIVPPSGQSRPLFIYFWPFQTPIQFLQQMNVKTDPSR